MTSNPDAAKLSKICSQDDSAPLPPISFDAFSKVEIRVGQITAASLNEKARKPAYVLSIDFGPFGIKTSSAQLTQNYTAEELVGRRILAVMNFPPKSVAGIRSEVLVLASVNEAQGVVLVEPDREVDLGSRIS
jgi:tRNA-binding protein